MNISSIDNIASINDKLFELAGYSQFSATAYSASTKRIYSISDARGPAKKIYLPIYLRKFRVIGLVDCGADITIMQESLYKKLFKDLSSPAALLERSDIDRIYSFSDHAISVKVLESLSVSLSPRV